MIRSRQQSAISIAPTFAAAAVAALFDPNIFVNTSSAATATSFPFAHLRSGNPVLIASLNGFIEFQSFGADLEFWRVRSEMYDVKRDTVESGVKVKPTPEAVSKAVVSMGLEGSLESRKEAPANFRRCKT